MSFLAFTSDSRDVRRGWDDFDRYVAWAVRQGDGQTFGEITRRLEPGIEFRLIRQALQLAVQEGRVERHRVRTVSGGPVPAITTRVVYRAAQQPATRKAA